MPILGATLIQTCHNEMNFQLSTSMQIPIIHMQLIIIRAKLKIFMVLHNFVSFTKCCKLVIDNTFFMKRFYWTTSYQISIKCLLHTVLHLRIRIESWCDHILCYMRPFLPYKVTTMQGHSYGGAGGPGGMCLPTNCRCPPHKKKIMHIFNLLISRVC